MPVASPWVATCDSFYTKPTTFENSMLQNGLFGILAARRSVSTAVGK